VQWDAKWCACSIDIPDNCCVTTCASSVAATGIPDRDKPAKTPRSTEQLLSRCGKIGAHIGTLAEQMYRRDGPATIRRILGLTGLARKHGAALTRMPVLPRWNPASPPTPISLPPLARSAGRN